MTMYSMLQSATLLLLTVITCTVAQQATSNSNFPDCTQLIQYSICNTQLSHNERIKQFLPVLSIEEKIALLSTTSNMLPRLNIEPYEWWNEALHGIGYSPGIHYTNTHSHHIYHDTDNTQYSTSFPQVLALSHTFNKSLIHAIGTAISTEARAFSNVQRAGLHYFTPNINTIRDVRWGRGQETYGEDTYYASQMSVTLVRALQGNNNDYIKIGATCKHYAAYDLEEFQGIDRLHYNANVTVLDLVETYLHVFKSCVIDGQALSVMCSYNSINGIPSCANQQLLDTVLRKQWQFSGYVVSDCAAVDSIYDTHHYTDTAEQAVADALKAGTDLDCDGQYYKTHMYDTYKQGLITEIDIDKSVTRILQAFLRVGYFDPAEQQEYRQITTQYINTQQHKQLAYQAALQSIVLLKNDKDVLPIYSNTIQSIALVGPLIDTTDIQLGNYNGRPEYIVSVQAAIEQRYNNIQLHTAHGCDTTLINPHNTFSDVVDAVKQADITIIVVGYGQDVASETVDRTSILLPGDQQKLIDTVKQTTQQPIILILMSGGCIDISMYKTDSQIQAILYTQYLGQSGGDAIRDVLFDGVYTPSGRLTTTWYDEQYIQQISMFDMSLHNSIAVPRQYQSYGRTYKYYYDTQRKYNGVYTFGYGLSYSRFKYDIVAPRDTYTVDYIHNTDTIQLNSNPIVFSLNVTITNTGAYDSEHSILAFITDEKTECKHQHIDCPLKQLYAFNKVYLHSQTQQTVQLDLYVHELTVVDMSGNRWLLHGQKVITVGVDGVDDVKRVGVYYKGNSVIVEKAPVLF